MLSAGSQPSSQEPSATPTPASSPANAMPTQSDATYTPPSSDINPYVEKARNMAESATLGNTGRIATGALKMLLPDRYGPRLDEIQKQRIADLEEWRKNNPIDAFITGAVGSAALLGPIGEAAGSIVGSAAKAVLPEAATNAISNTAKQFAAAFPHTAENLASAGTGAAAGAVYGAAAAPPGHTMEGAGTGAAFGAGAGPAMLALGRNVVPAIASKIDGVFNKWLAGSEGEAANAVALAPKASTEISNLTNEPFGSPTTPNAAGPSSLTGRLPLSPGQKSGDIETLRREEDARQRLLGTNAENQIKASDAGVAKATMQVGDQLKNNSNATASQSFESVIQQTQDAGNKAHKESTQKYTNLNESAAITILDKKKVGPSLGSNLSNVVNDPANQAAFKSKSGAPALKLFQDFKGIITGTKGRELPFNDLQAWRQDVAAEALDPTSRAGVMAGKLGKAYDDWMENSLTKDHVISGDFDVAAKAKDAASAWKSYKQNFDAKASPYTPGKPKPFDALPADLIQTVVGKSGFGTQTTALKIRGMVKALPTPEAQQIMKDNVFKGFISRAFEGTNGDIVALGTLKNNIRKFQQSQVYKEQFANDPEKHVVLTNLVDDLTKYVKATSDRTVVSPSGGAVLRGVQNLVGGLAGIPVVGKATGAKVIDTVLNKGVEMSQQSTDRAAFNLAMKNAAKEIHKAARSGPVFNIDSLKAGMLGGVASGTVQMNNRKENKK